MVAMTLVKADESDTPSNVGELLEFYLAHHVAYLKNRLGTERRLRHYVSEFAHLPLSGLTRRMVLEWHHRIGHTQGQTGANQALQQLRAMYMRAKDWEFYMGHNPTDRIKHFPEPSRTRFVRRNELPWLIKALEEEMPREHAFFLLLLFTGARRDEARTAKWTDLDLAEKLWHKPTTKPNMPHTVPLAPVLIEHLTKLPRLTEWVFPSQPNNKNKMQPGCWSVTGVEHAWRRIRKRAGLPDVRIHDLRRTCASWLAINGENLAVIQQTLGHSTLAVTQIYARLTIEPVRRALNAQAERMLATQPSKPFLSQTACQEA